MNNIFFSPRLLKSSHNCPNILISRAIHKAMQLLLLGLFYCQAGNIRSNHNALISFGVGLAVCSRQTSLPNITGIFPSI